VSLWTCQLTISQDSLLFSLPGEIRNHIYRYVLPDDPGTHQFTNTTAPTTPPLLDVCHHIRKEARLVFLLGNEFRVNLCNVASSKMMEWKHTMQIPDKSIKIRFDCTVWMDDVLNNAEHPKIVREESLHKLLRSFMSHHFGEWEIDKSSRCHLEQRAYHKLRIALKLGGHDLAAIKDIIEMAFAA